MTSVMLGFGPKHHQEELMQKCLTYIYIYIKAMQQQIYSGGMHYCGVDGPNMKIRSLLIVRRHKQFPKPPEGMFQDLAMKKNTRCKYVQFPLLNKYTV